MAHLTIFPFEFFNEIFTDDASQLLYHVAKKSKMTKNPNHGGVLILSEKLVSAFIYLFIYFSSAPH